MRTFYTYLHKKPDGSVFYVGKGVGSRAFSMDNRNIHWKRTVAKYGYEVQIVAYWDTEEEAFRAERNLIASFRDSGARLVNLTDGGEGFSGGKWSAEHRARWMAAMASNPNLGKKKSEEAKSKMRAKALGRVMSQETRDKIANKMRDRVFSDTHIANLSAAMRGGGNSMARPCIVHGRKFGCAQEAATYIGMSKSQVSRKCRRGTDQNYQYI